MSPSSGQILVKVPNIKFCEKSVQSKLSCAMQVDGWTDMTNMIVNFTTSECF